MEQLLVQIGLQALKRRKTARLIFIALCSIGGGVLGGYIAANGGITWSSFQHSLRMFSVMQSLGNLLLW
jgi:hypothetical protein